MSNISKITNASSRLFENINTDIANSMMINTPIEVQMDKMMYGTSRIHSSACRAGVKLAITGYVVGTNGPAVVGQ